MIKDTFFSLPRFMNLCRKEMVESWKSNVQPFYVLINNEGEPLNKSYSYDESIPKYIEFLQTGLENYKKER